MNDSALEILFEDNHLIFVTKPAGVLSQSDISGSEDMISVVSRYLAERGGKPGKAFVGLIHRLDRNVGGAMVFARTSKGASRASEDMRSGNFYKAYIAVSGKMPDGGRGESGFLVNRLKKDAAQNKVYESIDGKECRLFYKHLPVPGETEGSGKHYYLAVPLTGRTHQIRAQFALAGAPLCGDTKYGQENASGEKNGQERAIGLWSVAVSVRKTVDRSERIWAFSMPRGSIFEYGSKKLPKEIVEFVGSEELMSILESLKGGSDSE